MRYTDEGKPMTEYSLKYFQQIDGKDLWIAGMCAIGPFTTANPNKALRFDSEQDAMQHPAFCHPTCLTDIVEAPPPERDESQFEPPNTEGVAEY